MTKLPERWSRLPQALLVSLCLGATLGALEDSSIAADGDAPGAAVDRLPIGLPAMPPADNDSPALISYGAFLFRSPMLSRDGSLACASCHDPGLAFSGPAPHGGGGTSEPVPRHPPTLVNLYAASSLMWDGRAPDLQTQIHIPLESPTEMNIDWTASVARLSDVQATKDFLAASPASPLDRSLIISALASYVRSLVSGGSPFDRFFYLGEEDAISAEAKEGLTIFTRKARCSSCHLVSGESAALTDGNFHSVGVGFRNGAYADPGRFDVTGLPADRGLFKTPTLRDAAQRRFFMHDGSMKSLAEVVEYYDRGGNRSAPNLDPRIRPLFLSTEEKEALIAFLGTLSARTVSRSPR